MHQAIKKEGDRLYVEIKVVPGSSKNAWIPGSNELIRIKIAATPEDGKANAALIKFLADSLGCRKAEVTIISGEHSRNKKVAVPARTIATLEQLLD